MIKRIITLAAFLLFSTNAFAASRVWISEFSALASPSSGGSSAQIAVLPSVRNQSPLDISVSVQTSSAFNSNTRFIRVFCEVQCAIKGNATSTISDTPLAAGIPEYFGVAPNDTISVIANP